MLCFSQHSSVSVGPVLKYQVSQLFLGCQIKAGSEGLAGVRGARYRSHKEGTFPHSYGEMRGWAEQRRPQENKDQIPGHRKDPTEKKRIGTGEMAEPGKITTAKPKGLSLVPTICTVGGKN